MALALRSVIARLNLLTSQGAEQAVTPQTVEADRGSTLLPARTREASQTAPLLARMVCGAPQLVSPGTCLSNTGW